MPPKEDKSFLLLITPFGLIFLFFLIPYGLIVFSIGFWIIAMISSLLYSMKAFEIHGITEEDVKKMNRWRKVNQHWLNFAGALTGWFFLYFFLIYRACVFSASPFQQLTHNVNFIDLFIVYISLLGITGYIPYAVFLDKLR